MLDRLIPTSGGNLGQSHVVSPTIFRLTRSTRISLTQLAAIPCRQPRPETRYFGQTVWVVSVWVVSTSPNSTRSTDASIRSGNSYRNPASLVAPRSVRGSLRWGSDSHHPGHRYRCCYHPSLTGTANVRLIHFALSCPSLVARGSYSLASGNHRTRLGFSPRGIFRSSG
jgi:hypothetical protein